MKNYFCKNKTLPIHIKRFEDISAEPLFACKKRKFGIKKFFESRRETVSRRFNKKIAVRYLFTIMPIAIALVLTGGICISVNEKKYVFAQGTQDIKENFVLEQNNNKNLLLVVNSKFPLPKSYHPDLCDFSGIQCDRIIIDNLSAMLNDAKNSGFDLEVFKGYVDRQSQEETYNKTLTQLLAEGYTTVRAEATAEKLVSSVGKCEYETGLLVDIRAKNKDNVDFSSSEEFKWLINNCANYGFIQRYPAGKEEKTGKNMSPFAFRFIGVENAKKMRTISMCLDEYVKYLKFQ